MAGAAAPANRLRDGLRRPFKPLLKENAMLPY